MYRRTSREPDQPGADPPAAASREEVLRDVPGAVGRRDLGEARRAAAAAAAEAPGDAAGRGAGSETFSVELGWATQVTEPERRHGYVCSLCRLEDPTGSPGASLSYSEYAAVDHEVGWWDARVCRLCLDRLATDTMDLVDVLEHHQLAVREHYDAEHPDTGGSQGRRRPSRAGVRIKQGQLRAAERLVAVASAPVLDALGCDHDSIRRALGEVTDDADLVEDLLTELTEPAAPSSP